MISFEHKLSSILSLSESMTTDGIIRAINKQRKLKHLNPVNPNHSISVAAKIQAKQMASTGEFGHTLKGVKYPTLDDRMRASGYSYAKAGEVLYSGADDSDAAIRGWLGSKPHREAILHPDVEEIGAAVQYSDKGRPYACAVVCIPSGGGREDEENEENEEEKYTPRDIADRVIEVAKEYGKKAAKKLLIKVSQSDYVKDLAKSPIIQKIVKALR